MLGKAWLWYAASCLLSFEAVKNMLTLEEIGLSALESCLTPQGILNIHAWYSSIDSSAGVTLVEC